MSESNDVALDALQELQDSVESAVEGTTLTVDYKDEELESKTILLQDLINVGSGGVAYMEAGSEVIDAWEVIASVGLTEPTDVVETDV
jgi:hypothetical protein